MIRAWRERRRDDDDLTIYRTIADIGPTTGAAVRQHTGIPPKRVLRALGRLQDRGAISSYLEKPIPAGGEPRRVYVIRLAPRRPATGGAQGGAR